MNKNNVVRLSLTIILCAGTLQAREFRTPSPFYNNRFNHYPLPWPTTNECAWSVQIWGAGLHRDTDKAFMNKNSTDKESLAGIFFNQDSFTLIEAFAPGSFNPAFPLVGVLVFTPNFDYHENTAFFGFTLDRTFGCCNEWHAGVRVQIPYRSIKTELNGCCDPSEDPSAVRRLEREQVLDENGNPQVVDAAFAYRLDFLASLPTTVNAPMQQLVKFVDPNKSNHITMNNADVTQAPGAIIDQNPVTVIQIDSGAVPPPPFTLRQTSNVGGASVLPSPGDGTGLPFLDANGNGPGNGLRARFDDATNYGPLATNLANQRKLWVVPTGATQAGTFGVVPNANSISTMTEDIIRGGLTSPSDFLSASDITFDPQRSVGVGDLDTIFYVRYYGCEYRWFAEADFGIRFPTGHRIDEPNRLLLVPTGNNHHYEIKFGGFGGWMPCNWFGFTVDSFYSFVLRSHEKVAASFLGATVKNIGPAVNADIRWGYYLGNIDFNFLIPCYYWPVGIDIGYQIYVKQKDHIRFRSTTAADLFGVTQTLDPSVLEQRTNQIAHKIKTEIFHRGLDWQICAGWQQVFAGKNATHDTDWYLGFSVYF